MVEAWASTSWLEAALEHADGVTGIAHCDMAAAGWQITAYVVGERGQALAHNVVLPSATTGSPSGPATAELIDDADAAAGFPPRPCYAP